MSDYILAIDQGTTSTRSMLFDSDGRVAAVAQQEFPQHFPRPGWVEHDPEDLWRTAVETVREVMAKAGVSAAGIAGIGITNQRETTLVWDRESGLPVSHAIVWQDRRTADQCLRLKEAGLEPRVTERTGLMFDPYFSGTKIAWILDNVEGARALARNGRLAFGTVDSFLLWRLTGGRQHATDATNASRTLLLDIREGAWAAELAEILDVPLSMLPEVRDSAADFGETDAALFGGPIRILGIAGDQQAATVGQACFRPGMVKSTYGTGCFALINTGEHPIPSPSRLLSTIAYQLDGRRTYALEGSIFIAGAAVQWLRDSLGIIKSAADTAELAARADPTEDIYLVPAFVGMGAPHWDPKARGALFGLTRGFGPAELARAALEAVCYQSYDLIEAMRRDWAATQIGGSGTEESAREVLRVDGGMVANDWAMQFLADILGRPVDRPEILETTALGAAYLAGYRAGFYPPPERFSERWHLERRFEPAMATEERERRLAGWHDAVERTLSKR